MQRLTDAEQLAEIERVIAMFRHARSMPETPDGRAYQALKAAADQIRGRQADRITETVRELDRAIADLEASRQPGVPGPQGYSFGSQHHLAMQIRARWPTIRQAIIFYGEAVDAGVLMVAR